MAEVTGVAAFTGGAIARTSRALSLLAVASMFGVVLFDAGVVAAATRAPAGGTVKVFETPRNNGGRGSIVITGAIGDYGR